MVDNALSKVNRATKHIYELTEFLRQKRPFRYVFETNLKSGECAIYAERDEALISEITDIAYDIVQNLRTALDYAYWQIVSPFASSDRERRAIQFPFSETGARLDEAVKNRLADRVSQSFFDAVMALKPHGECGGNELLFSIHSLAAGNRHRFPTPVADYKELSSEVLRAQIPHFPKGLNMMISVGAFDRDVIWQLFPLILLSGDCVFKRELDVPVDIVIQFGTSQNVKQMIPALNAMIDKTNEAIQVIRSA